MNLVRNKYGKFIKGHPAYNFKGVTWKICPYCNDFFYVISRTRSKAFCSYACAGKSRMMALRIAGKLLKGKTVACKWCKKDVYAAPRKVDKNNFCSKACFYSYRKGFINDKMRDALDRGRRSMKGKKRSQHHKDSMSKAFKKKWTDQAFREKSMLSRTPEKLMKMREGHRIYLENNKGHLPIGIMRRHRKVIDGVIKNGNRED